jgi:hypothetical protein
MKNIHVLPTDKPSRLHLVKIQLMVKTSTSHLMKKLKKEIISLNLMVMKFFVPKE